MLLSLDIKNIALIDHAEFRFGEGLNVLSGETGAGKSVILDSIDFALGAKATAGMIRSGATECSVRAEFTLPEGIGELLDELDIEADDCIVISRKYTSDGKGSVKVNGCTVTASMLRKLTSRLVDVHGQSEHFFLLKESNQLRLLDKIAGEETANNKAEVVKLLERRKDILARLEAIGGDEGERDRRLDILRFQIGELERADVKEGEEERLLSLRTQYENAERILTGLNGARESLLADGGGADAVGYAVRSLSQISRFGDYSALTERLENALSELNDVGETIESLAEELDVDDAERERVENRIDEIRALKKKYGGSVGEMARFLAHAKEEYDLLADSGEKLERLKQELGKAEEELYRACLALTESRKRAAKGFTERVVEELKTLNIASARFEVAFDEYGRNDLDKTTREGLGGIRFLFSANAGEPLKELGKIISGGEMSRFMLAVKTQLGSLYGIGTYLFDEIDAGISGKTARAVAEKFCKIARGTQIIAVSHLAQIAAFADRQFLIEKTEAGDKTTTTVKELTRKERLAELARLSAGDADSRLSLLHAEELLQSAESYKNSL